MTEDRAVVLPPDDPPVLCYLPGDRSKEALLLSLSNELRGEIPDEEVKGLVDDCNWKRVSTRIWNRSNGWHEVSIIVRQNRSIQGLRWILSLQEKGFDRLDRLRSCIQDDLELLCPRKS